MDVARSARDASQLVREAWARYKSPVDYGIVPSHLNKVAALIAAGLPARLYYPRTATTPSTPMFSRANCTSGC